MEDVECVCIWVGMYVCVCVCVSACLGNTMDVSTDFLSQSPYKLCCLCLRSIYEDLVFSTYPSALPGRHVPKREQKPHSL